MNLFELQTRANALVAKVNAYEDTIEDMTLDENEIIDQHLYADIFCLRTVMHRLFATNPTDRASTSLSTTDIDWSMVTQTAVGRNEIWKLNDNSYRGQGSVSQYNSDITTNNDMMSHYNMIVGEPAYPYAKYLLSSTSAQTKAKLVSGNCFNVYGAHISDALVTESQTSNIFRWNTTPEDDITNVSAISNIPQQVPGIVTYYLGSGYDGEYSATIPYNTNKSSVAVNYNTPAIYGAFYKDAYGPEDIVSQQPKNRGAEGLRMFMPGTTFFNGGAISPIDIYQPFPRYDITSGYNYQGKALYHELVFKRRRAGCSSADVDFLPFKQFETGANDNDPQGLAMRLALAQQKPYYYNRPWFTELDELYTTEGSKQAALADKIIEKMKYEVTNYDYSAFSEHGRVVINTSTGECTGFITSKNDYISRSNTLTSGEVSSFSIVVGVTLDDINSSYTDIIKFSSGASRTWRILYRQQPDIVRLVAKDSTNTSIILDAQWTPSASGTQYIYVKYNYDGTTYTYQTSTDKGLTWSQSEVITPTNTNKPVTPQNDLLIGVGGGGSGITAFDLKVFECTINNESLGPTKTIATETMTDSEFYNSYQLDYSTYAEALDEPQ